MNIYLKKGGEHIFSHSNYSCDGHKFRFQILEKLSGSGYNVKGDVDENMTERRTDCENIKL